ncbi:MAG TPA: ABC transporter ATP-binding protein [Candidatus Saccharimonadia bacterium]|jgi:ABC-2 type transport system ATP-binding protein|nr:ABC transporter ATP-binding protein [Candidatus Saccharimonadia bacterium]
MKAAIRIEDVTKNFGAKRALDQVSLEVPAGQIFGFLGPNGAGKTTTIRSLMDFIRPDEGRITVFGQDVRDNPAIKRDIGYLPADLQLRTNWMAQTHLNFLGGIKGGKRTAELVRLLGLDTGKKVSDLSSGNQQKLAIVLAFLGNPKLLILDEPTRGLDPLLQNQLYELLKEFAAGGGTVFFSSHNLAEVQEICDSVAVIKEGKIVASEAMHDLLKLSTHLIKAKASRPFNLGDFKAKDIEVVAHEANTIALKVSGPIDAPIKVLATYHLTNLEVTHASLEDTFMEYYS